MSIEQTWTRQVYLFDWRDLVFRRIPISTLLCFHQTFVEIHYGIEVAVTFAAGFNTVLEPMPNKRSEVPASIVRPLNTGIGAAQSIPFDQRPNAHGESLYGFIGTTSFFW